jgi:hypothetical protein
MAEKWLIEDEKWIVEQSLADSDNWVIQTANTQRYIGSSNDLDYVYLFAASPLMLEALEAAREYVINTTTDCRECGEPNSSSSRDKTIGIIDAAIAAAKGE